LTLIQFFFSVSHWLTRWSFTSPQAFIVHKNKQTRENWTKTSASNRKQWRKRLVCGMYYWHKKPSLHHFRLCASGFSFCFHYFRDKLSHAMPLETSLHLQILLNSHKSDFKKGTVSIPFTWTRKCQHRETRKLVQDGKHLVFKTDHQSQSLLSLSLAQPAFLRSLSTQCHAPYYKGA
jgi:hypothetical protein